MKKTIDHQPIERISLLSSSYSGSTLLGIIISQNPSFLAFGDTYIHNHFSPSEVLCTCGESVENCRVRVVAAEKLNEYNLDKDLLFRRKHTYPIKLVSEKYGGLKLYSLYKLINQIFGYKYVFSDFLNSNNIQLNAIKHASPQTTHFFDGAKNIIRGHMFLETDPRSKLVHLIRHPFEVLYSAATRHEIYDGKHNIRKHAHSWCTYNLAAARLVEAYSNRTATVTHKGLLERPKKTIENLFETLDWPTSNIDIENIDPKKAHVLGNRSRHRATKIRNEKSRPTPEMLYEKGLSSDDIELLERTIEKLDISDL